jgi:hypothetical protein
MCRIMSASLGVFQLPRASLTHYGKLQFARINAVTGAVFRYNGGHSLRRRLGAVREDGVRVRSAGAAGWNGCERKEQRQQHPGPPLGAADAGCGGSGRRGRAWRWKQEAVLQFFSLGSFLAGAIAIENATGIGCAAEQHIRLLG